jgi:(1->4)-alpha-D-glucan 1-alpha-D-glucosylmutase
VREFVAAILAPARRNTFPELFRPLADQIAQLGAINSLSQVLIKLTAPGVPDIYQGNEMWDLSLVDPDNRRPVDYEKRRQALAGIAQAAPEDMITHWRDGRIKLFLTHKLLQYRREHFDLFAKGDYLPVQAAGVFGDSVFSYVRAYERQTLLVIAPRLSGRVGFPPLGERWQETAVDFPAPQPLRDLFTGRDFDPSVGRSLAVFPFAAFVTGA